MKRKEKKLFMGIITVFVLLTVLIIFERTTNTAG